MSPDLSPDFGPGASSPDPVPPQPAPPAPPGAAPRPSLLRRPGPAWVVALLAVCVAVVFATLWAPLHLEARARADVRDAATELVLHLVTFEGEHIEEWVAATQARATGEYADQVNALFDRDLREALREAQAESRGTLLNLFVQDVDGDHAVVFAVARQEIRNVATPQPVEDELRIQMEFRRTGGEWLASNVEVLGPSGLTPPTPGEE